MESGWFVVIGAAIGAAISAAPVLIMGWLNQRAEKEKHLRQLAIDFSLAEYEKSQYGQVPPFAYLLANYTSIKTFLNDNISSQQIDDAYKAIAEIREENRKSGRKYLLGKED